jgi:hypothetical protein
MVARRDCKIQDGESPSHLQINSGGGSNSGVELKSKARNISESRKYPRSFVDIAASREEILIK